jgi:hypothetical protein
LRFHGDKSKQLNAVNGSPDLVVPEKHLVRDVIAFVVMLDLTELRNRHKLSFAKTIEPPRTRRRQARCSWGAPLPSILNSGRGMWQDFQSAKEHRAVRGVRHDRGGDRYPVS